MFTLSNLRISQNKPEIFAVTSGKGGVGKTSVSINLSLLLKRLKKKVLLVDADIHLGNVDLLLGLRPDKNLSDVLAGDNKLEEIITPGPAGLDILPASSAVIDMLDMEDRMVKEIGEAFSQFEHSYDVVMVDTGAGIGRNVTSFLLGADKIMVVVTPDPASIADAYGVIKVITMQSPETPILMVANMVKSEEEGESIYRKMDLMVKRFLDSKLIFGGAILRDNVVVETVRAQKPLVLEHPNARPVNSLKLITRNLLKLPSRDAEDRTSLFTGFRANRDVGVGASND